MRTAAILSSLPLLLAVACGGAPKHVDSADDTNSLEGSGSSASAGSSSSSSSSSASSESSGSAGSAAPASSSQPSGDAPAADAAPAAAVHPTPAATGSIDGKPFAPKLAQVSGPMQKDGRVLISIHEGSDCVTSADAKPGVASLMMMVPWKDGMKADIGSMTPPKGKKMGDIWFSRVGDDGKSNKSPKAFKPTGTVTIVKAPMDQNAVGKMKIDMAIGDYMLAGDLDVKVCFPPK